MQILSRKTRLRTSVFAVEEIVIVDEQGKRRKRSVVVHQGSAVIIPVNDEGKVLLVRQWRAPIEAPVWELPAGRVDEGEQPLKAARRELREETGLHAREWRRLARLHPSPGYVSECMHLFLATKLTQQEANPEEDEHLTLRWFAPAELERAIENGLITDAKTIAGVLLAWRLLGG
ncbi:MAG: NUDIX hydrolase [Bryobacterales bacterium]|nr:NUDIX hydrolase [Bryobacterales bacterium]